jgi:hypothetical protein
MSNEKTIVRLQELLDLRDIELETLQGANADLQRQITFGVDWMRQRRGYLAAGLPVPRLELTLLSNEAHVQEFEVVLVNANRDGTCTRVPLEYSKRSGNRMRTDQFPDTGDIPVALHDYFPGTFSDLVFNLEKLAIPAFMVLAPEKIYSVVLGTEGRRWPATVTAVTPHN